jgi:hypothetical protein
LGGRSLIAGSEVEDILLDILLIAKLKEDK